MFIHWLLLVLANAVYVMTSDHTKSESTPIKVSKFSQCWQLKNNLFNSRLQGISLSCHFSFFMRCRPLHESNSLLLPFWCDACLQCWWALFDEKGESKTSLWSTSLRQSGSLIKRMTTNEVSVKFVCMPLVWTSRSSWSRRTHLWRSRGIWLWCVVMSDDSYAKWNVNFDWMFNAQRKLL